MTFERSLIEESIFNYRKNLACVVGTVLALVAISTLRDVIEDHTGESSSTMGVVSTMLWLIVLIPAHATILKGQSGLAAVNDGRVLTGFMWRSFVFTGVGIAAAVATFLFWKSLAPQSVVLKNEIGIIILAFAAYGLSQVFVLSVWGTWLPAVVAGGDKSFRAAQRRSKSSFGYILARLTFCVGPLFALTFLISFGFLINTERSGLIWSKETGFDAVALIVQFLNSLAIAFDLVMLATVLSRAYLIAEENSRSISGHRLDGEEDQERD